MKRFLALVLVILTLFALVACNMSVGVDGAYDAVYIGDGGYYGGRSGYGASSKIAAGGVTGVYEGDGEGIPEDQQTIEAGQMTAKAWDDNEHYDEWPELFAAKTDNDPAKKFNAYLTDQWVGDSSKRVKITVTSEGGPVMGAEITYYGADQRKYVALTNVGGVAYLFPPEDEGRITVKSGDAVEAAEFTAEERDLTVSFTDGASRANAIEIMFVIDATGSMGDEMHYLTAELEDVVHRVAEQTEEVRIDLALLFYRDDGDEEKFAYHDFVTVTEKRGLTAQLTVLSKQRAMGGGDTPEAADEAMLLATGKNWSEENSTKLIFWVLDAPPHETEQAHARMASAVNAASAKGIRICPILCSGADNLCEYVTRMSALLTGGTSVFVTDDSGIGGSHLDPDLPEATVEKLNDLLVRLIVGYHTGDFGTPVPWNEGQVGQEGDTEPPAAETSKGETAD